MTRRMINPARWGGFALTLSLLVLTACGADTEPEASTTADPTTTAATETPTTVAPTSTTGVADPAEVPEGPGVVTENPDGTRTVEWADGSATVPATPERIVTVIGDIDLESLLAVGITPIASGTQDGTVEGGFAPHLTELTADVERLAWSDGVPFESIAALQPDLIFTPEEFEPLSQIAPTVPSGSWAGEEWRQDFLYITEVVSHSEEAAEVLGDLEARMAEVGAAATTDTEGLTVATAQVAYDHSQVLVEAADSFASSVLTDLGLTVAPLVEGTSGDPIALSFERLDALQADIIFWQVRQAEGGAPDEEGLAMVTESPLWESLPAVAADRVYFVENRPWYFPTILSATQIVDDVEAALAPPEA